MLGLDGGFGELAAVSGKQGAAVTFSESFAPFVNHHFSQCVQLALACRLETDFSAKKKIEPARKGAARSACAFGNGFDQSVRLREPVNDQAGVGEAREANGDGPRRMHAWSIGHACGLDDAKGWRPWQLRFITAA